MGKKRPGVCKERRRVERRVRGGVFGEVGGEGRGMEGGEGWAKNMVGRDDRGRERRGLDVGNRWADGGGKAGRRVG